MIINRHELLKYPPHPPIKFMVNEKKQYKGLSWGLTECGYDIRIAENVWMCLGRRFVRSVSVECFQMPDDLMGRVLNKSTWARLGVDASMTTNIEPGWRGHLTLELRYTRARPIFIPAGVGIAQVIFERIAVPASYEGKYQNQPAKPVPARR